jgi:SAM-dependent methyltransferase
MLERHKQNWEELGELDPLWAVLSDPARRYGGWDIDEFFQTGEETFSRLLDRATLYGVPSSRDRALDFGCGVGRLTRAVATRFRECYGLDISEEMIRQARALNSSARNCVFRVSGESTLEDFPAEHFDCVLSLLVLQHLPSKRLILTTISGFMRVLHRGGLLVFQLPSFIPVRNRVQPRRRAYQALRMCGFDQGFLYRSLGLNPIRMNYIPLEKVLDCLQSAGGRVLFHETHAVFQKGLIHNTTYYVTK